VAVFYYATKTLTLIFKSVKLEKMPACRQVFMHLSNFKKRRPVMINASNFEPKSSTSFLKPFLALIVRHGDGREEVWRIDVAGKTYLYFDQKAKTPTGRLLAVCKYFEKMGIRVVGYGSFSGEGGATHIIRDGKIFVSMEKAVVSESFLQPDGCVMKFMETFSSP
jgi:hypothetical protein